MEFLNGIFAKFSGHKLDSSQARVFVWFFTLIFSVLQNALHVIRLEFSCFADFLKKIFKTREEYGFFF